MQRLLILAISFLAISNGFAQTRDFELRQNAGIDWSPLKRTELSGGYRLTLNDNSSRFKSSMISLGVSYDLKKWWKAGVEYRFYTSYDQDKNRFQFFTRFNYDINKFTLVYRLQYQQNQDYFDREYLQVYPPQRIFRNRLQLKYEYTKKLEVYAYAEPFSELKYATFSWNRTRYAIGTSYLYKKKSSFTAELFYSDEFGVRNPGDKLALDLAYTYHFKGSSAGKNGKKPKEKRASGAKK